MGDTFIWEDLKSIGHDQVGALGLVLVAKNAYSTAANIAEKSDGAESPSIRVKIYIPTFTMTFGDTYWKPSGRLTVSKISEVWKCVVTEAGVRSEIETFNLRLELLVEVV